MTLRRKLVGLLAATVCAFSGRAQDLAPRAYVITPLHANAIIVTSSFYDGGLNFSDTIPITGATGKYNIPEFTCYHAFSFFRRSGNITASLPYAVGTFSGEALGKNHSIYRSGLVDFNARFSVNLIGGRAMQPEEFAKWKQKTLLGVSLNVVAPTGQYDGRKLVNWGLNRWAIKPQLGYSERWSNWILDAYAGVWFYTTNPAFYDTPIPKPQTERPVRSLETHLSYDFKPRAWVSLDGNFWWGGITALSGIADPATKQTGSRVGATISVPVTKRQSIKFAYSNGIYIRFGGNYQRVQVAWQYGWIGWPK